MLLLFQILKWSVVATFFGPILTHLEKSKQANKVPLGYGDFNLGPQRDFYVHVPIFELRGRPHCLLKMEKYA